MKKIFIIFTVIFSTLSYSVNAQTILHTNDSDKIDISENSEITPDLFPQTSRYMHDLNMRLIYALKPALDEYKEQKISPIHKGFSNFLKNLQEPLNAVNSLLQLDFSSTFKTIGRFAINSTAGMFGVMDVAGRMGLKRDNRDFGQTLGVYGVPMGGFFVMPVYAQTTTRDFAGTIVDTIFNPINYYTTWSVGLFLSISTSLMDLYGNYDFILSTNETSIDSYNTFKTMYLQHRKNMIEQHQLFFKDSAPQKEETNKLGQSYDYDFDMEY